MTRQTFVEPAGLTEAGGANTEGDHSTFALAAFLFTNSNFH